MAAKYLYKCTQCGGSNVEIKVWFDPNTNKPSEDTDSLDRSDCWCKDCEEHTELEVLEQ